jgi:hypothetical protein
LEQAASLPEVLVAARPTAAGYQVEAAIPWSALGVAIADHRILVLQYLCLTMTRQIQPTSRPCFPARRAATWEIQPHGICYS